MSTRTHSSDVFGFLLNLHFLLKARICSLFHPQKAATGGFHVEMMGLISAGNNPMVGMTVAVAVAVEEASK